ncbi:hypothetical protein OJAV_G00019780 [Oryzias javanicus]|uniref:Uncharacterized protein n=1 Tax=Oryzias javanicus TaxID=123683 RepID=A0A3S2UMI2_ORYJA|nr:hypothetical protein OJAV_G00019780 [Oryzias javanicus]
MYILDVDFGRWLDTTRDFGMLTSNNSNRNLSKKCASSSSSSSSSSRFVLGVEALLFGTFSDLLLNT